MSLSRFFDAWIVETLESEDVSDLLRDLKEFADVTDCDVLRFAPAPKRENVVGPTSLAPRSC